MSEIESPPQRYPFAIGDRVVGAGITGEVVQRPGPYSVTVKPDRPGPEISIPNNMLQPEQSAAEKA